MIVKAETDRRRKQRAARVLVLAVVAAAAPPLIVRAWLLTGAGCARSGVGDVAAPAVGVLLGVAAILWMPGRIAVRLGAACAYAVAMTLALVIYALNFVCSHYGDCM
jgi:hypothetical protein